MSETSCILEVSAGIPAQMTRRSGNGRLSDYRVSVADIEALATRSPADVVLAAGLAFCRLPWARCGLISRAAVSAYPREVIPDV